MRVLADLTQHSQSAALTQGTKRGNDRKSVSGSPKCAWWSTSIHANKKGKLINQTWSRCFDVQKKIELVQTFEGL